jgi:hypothetical protein
LVTVGAQIEALTYGTPGSTDYLVTVERGADAGAFTADLSLATSLPANVTFSFANPDLSFADGDSSESTILTISTQTGAQATSSPFSFTVQAQNSSDSTDSATGDGSLSIAPKLLAASITASDKAYDGTTAASISSAVPVGAISGDDVSITGGTATFDTKDVGTGKTVTDVGLTLAGADAADYSISDTATTTADITQLALTPSIIISNKPYDGTTAATISFESLPTAIATDDVGITGGTATFASQNAGTGIAVNVTGLTLTGTDAPNYSITGTASSTANITQVALTPVVTVASKTYDGTTAATISAESLMGAVTGDDVKVTGGTATFSSASAATGVTVNITGLTLSGTTAGNYSITGTATTTANINPATLTVTADNQSIVPGSAIPTLTATDSGFVNGETLATSDVTGAPSLSTTAASSSSAGDYPITVTQGTLAATNYTFTFVNGTLNITAPNIAGSWSINGMVTTIQETGSALTFINEAGEKSSGGFLSASQIGANTWGSGNLTGNLVNNNTEIDWSNGTVWTQGPTSVPSIAGSWLINGMVTTIQETGSALTFINEAGQQSSGGFTSASQIAANTWGSGNLTGNLANNNTEIDWSNGTVWTQGPTSVPSIAGSWLINGMVTTIQETGSALTFINEAGEKSSGGFLSASQIAANTWGSGNLTGNLANNNTEIDWSNGTVWVQGPTSVPSIAGSWLINGMVTTIEETGSALTFINEAGMQSSGGFLSASQIAANTWGSGNLTGNLVNNNTEIDWSNGTVWAQGPTSVPSIAGSWLINGMVTTIQQTGSALTFINEAGVQSSGGFLSASQIGANTWGSGNLTGNLVNNNTEIDWANGTVWAVATMVAPTVQSETSGGAPATVTGTWDSANAKTLNVTVGSTTYTLGTDPQLTSPSTGNWSLDLSAVNLPKGATNVTAVSTNSAGNSLQGTGSITLTIDPAELTSIHTYLTTNQLTGQQTSSGLNYVITTPGTGPVPTSGQSLTVDYSGFILNADGTLGTEFDSNVDPQFNHVQPFQFTLGQGQVIAGWDEAFALLPVGTVAKLLIPSELAYGSASQSNIPANSILEFDVTLISAS